MNLEYKAVKGAKALHRFRDGKSYCGKFVQEDIVEVADLRKRFGCPICKRISHSMRTCTSVDNHYMNEQYKQLGLPRLFVEVQDT